MCFGDSMGPSSTGRPVILFESLVYFLMAILLFNLSSTSDCGDLIDQADLGGIFGAVTLFSLYLILIVVISLVTACRPTDCLMKILIYMLALNVVLSTGEFAYTSTAMTNIYSKSSFFNTYHTPTTNIKDMSVGNIFDHRFDKLEDRISVMLFTFGFSFIFSAAMSAVLSQILYRRYLLSQGIDFVGGGMIISQTTAQQVPASANGPARENTPLARPVLINNYGWQYDIPFWNSRYYGSHQYRHSGLGPWNHQGYP